MSGNAVLLPMLAHAVWAAVLYGLLTVVRAPAVWGIGRRANGENPWARVEPRVSANLSNQFEWPLFFHVGCLIAIIGGLGSDAVLLWLAWTFIAGRLLHSGVQILSTNVRLRGVAFTINFVAVLGVWAWALFSMSGAPTP